VLKRPVFGKSPAEVPCFLNELRQACKTAKPLCVGSIPTRASKFLKNIKKELRPSFSRGFWLSLIADGGKNVVILWCSAW
jgi:hypothetical protein